MDSIKKTPARYTSLNQAILDGLFSGFGAGAGMALFMLVVGFASGLGPRDVLVGFSPGPNAGPLAGIVTHLAVSGVYGLIFGLLDYFVFQHIRIMSFPWRGLILGGAYGSILWLFAVGFVLSSNSPMLEFPAIGLVAAHLVYGMILGVLIGRTRSA